MPSGRQSLSFCKYLNQAYPSLAGISYGAMYGGSTTSILLNMPGEAASVVTCLEGYVMARKGRAGPALGMSAFGSFVGGTVGIIGLMIIGPPLALWALKFGPPEYFSVMVLGLTLLTFMGSKSMIRALMMAVLGLFISTIGVDYISGKPRFTYHIMSLMDGLDIVPVVMGLFGVAEVLINTSLPPSVRRKCLTSRKTPHYNFPKVRRSS